MGSGQRWALAVVAAVAALAIGTVVGFGFTRAGESRTAPFLVPSLPNLPTPLTRSSLRTAAFGTARLPRTTPAIERSIDDPRFSYSTRIDRLTVELPNGFTSVAYDLWPRSWKGRVMIFHNGHHQDLDASPQVLKWFLKRGWRVISMAMPLAGQNASPGFPREGGHDQLARLKRPLALFLEPVVAVVNYTHADVMVGLSGGGWTTVVAAAIDPRITRAYSVAGSIPWPWRCVSGRSGCGADLEQRLIPTYLRLYELGAQPPRREMALYNFDDPCCFSGRSSDIWAPRLRGNFSAVVDMSST